MLNIFNKLLGIKKENNDACTIIKKYNSPFIRGTIKTLIKKGRHKGEYKLKIDKDDIPYGVLYHIKGGKLKRTISMNGGIKNLFYTFINISNTARMRISINLGIVQSYNYLKTLINGRVTHTSLYYASKKKHL